MTVETVGKELDRMTSPIFAKKIGIILYIPSNSSKVEASNTKESVFKDQPLPKALAFLAVLAPNRVLVFLVHDLVNQSKT